MRLTDFKALTFDCYGTLIDWESGMVEGLKPLTARVDRGLSRDDILQAHARHESSQQAWTPGKRYSESAAYGRSVKDWPAFPDSADALQYLKKHYKLVILSNVDNESFAGSNQRLGVEFDAIYTAEDVGSYKPSDRNFDYMLDKLKAHGVEKQDILHTAESMFHDHVPGKRHGLASCWIYRRHDKDGFGATMNPGNLPDVNFRFNSMADLVKAHQQALGA